MTGLLPNAAFYGSGGILGKYGMGERNSVYFYNTALTSEGIDP